ELVDEDVRDDGLRDVGWMDAVETERAPEESSREWHAGDDRGIRCHEIEDGVYVGDRHAVCRGDIEDDVVERVDVRRYRLQLIGVEEVIRFGDNCAVVDPDVYQHQGFERRPAVSGKTEIRAQKANEVR